MAQQPVTCGTAEAAKKLGVSRQTLLRWFAERRITEVRRDHNNWRVFTDQDLDRIRSEVRGNADAQ
jgi:excisionase family DNA binding protein